MYVTTNRADDVGVEGAAQNLLREDYVEVRRERPEALQGAKLKSWPAARDSYYVYTAAGALDSPLEPAFKILPFRHEHREVANLAESDHKADVGKAFNEKQYAQSRVASARSHCEGIAGALEDSDRPATWSKRS
jgi:hypothetical protein